MSARQLAKLIALVTVTFSICISLLWISDGSASPIFEEILSTFNVIATLLATLSVVMFNYIENISKDLGEIRKDVKRTEFCVVIDALSSLKREILLNGGLIVTLLILEKTIKGLSLYLFSYIPEGKLALFLYFILSLRFSFFCVSVFAASIQLKGFITAIEYRDIFLKNRK